jgi:hypothetical protein
MIQLKRWLKTLIREVNTEQKGMAMVLALIVLALGTLLIIPSLSYMVAGVKSTAIHKRLTSELYAADAFSQI